MAISLFKVMDSHVSPLYRHYHIDYDDDTENLPGLDECCVGSTALSAESGTQYIIGSDGQWVVDLSSKASSGSSVTLEELTVDDNGEYNAPAGKAYSRVLVALPAYDGTINYS